MKAVGVFPGKANSVHLTEIPEPSLSDIPNGRGVLVKVLRVGVDGTAVTTSPVRMRGAGLERSRDSARLYGHCGLEKIINTSDRTRGGEDESASTPAGSQANYLR